MPEELWTEICDIVQEAVIKTIPKKKKCKKAKWLSEEVLRIAETTRETKGKREKERYTHLNAQFQRIARRDKKVFLSNQCCTQYVSKFGKFSSGLEKVSFYSNPIKRQCQRILKLPHNCTHLTC